jgi:hypothetical protein
MRPSSVDIALATRHAITDKILGTNIDAQPGPSGARSRATSASNKCAGRLSMPRDRTLARSEVIRVARQPSCQGRFFPSPQISNVGLIIRFRIQCPLAIVRS